MSAIEIEPVAFRVNRPLGLQAAIEMDVWLIAVLTDGLIFALPEDKRLSSIIEKRWRKRMKQLLYDKTLRWNDAEWKERGVQSVYLRVHHPHTKGNYFKLYPRKKAANANSSITG